MQHLISQFDALSKEYREYISNKLSIEDFREYNEILFSAHNSNIQFTDIDIQKSQRYKDFGQAFYLSDIQSQALVP